MPSRRPAPATLFTAVAATVVILPWAISGGPATSERDSPRAEDTILNQQALTGVGGGETVREVSQAAPFSMVALTGTDLGDTSARVRAKRADGGWGPWYETKYVEHDADGGSGPDGPRGTDPVYLGETTAVQIALRRPPGAPLTSAPPESGLDAGRDLGYLPANTEHSLGQTISAVLIAIVRSIYAYHTMTLGWCDIAYNALVDKYGQVFEGRAGGITKDVLGAHTGGFNRDVWGVSMIGDFEETPPPDIMVKNLGRLLGWRLGLDRVDPAGTIALKSAGGSYTHFPAGATPQLPEIFAHRDVGNTECPGNAGYAALAEIRDIAARFNQPPDVMDSLRGGAILARWEADGGPSGPLGTPTSPEAAGDGSTRYATFERGAMYWSPETGAQPLTGAIYEAWASLGYERGALGLPTSGEIPEPQWVVQNFQHGTLNFDRQTHNVLRVIDGVTLVMPPPPLDGPPTQLERFSPVQSR
ncbi:MAG: cold-shock protein [Mycobacteriaceae bacterium]|nr:cold-shock protein [Mycobacteriaceae bacterium]